MFPKVIRTSTNIAPKIDQNYSKIYQNRSQGPLGELWRPSWPQDGSKSQHRLQNLVRWTPLDVEVGGPNPPKIGPKLIQNVIIFLLIFWTDFWSDLVPTWTQLDSQNPSKMEPSWVPKAIQEATDKKHKNIKKPVVFLMFLEGPRVPSWNQNRSKIGSKRHQKQDAILNGFWMALGSILGGFWKPSWIQIGPKIGPKRG